MSVPLVTRGYIAGNGSGSSDIIINRIVNPIKIEIKDANNFKVNIRNLDIRETIKFKIKGY